MPVPSGYGESSLDFIVCYMGRFIAIETKAGARHPTPRQEVIIKRIVEAGGIAIVIDTTDTTVLQKVFDGIRSGKQAPQGVDIRTRRRRRKLPSLPSFPE
jgi:hypothetical protein